MATLYCAKHVHIVTPIPTPYFRVGQESKSRVRTRICLHCNVKEPLKWVPMLHFGHNVKYIKGDIDGTCKWTFSVIVIPEWRVDPSSVDMFSRITFRIAHSATVYTVIVSQRIYLSRFGGDNPGLSSNCRRSLDITTTFIKQHDGIYV